jgi:orotidine-5'-phosphate decarboxylase
MSAEWTRGRAPIAVAMDAESLVQLRDWTRAVAETVSTVKIGLEAFCRDGGRAVRAARSAAEEVVADGVDIFLDLKLHDIPATVAGASRAVADLEPMYLTVHAAGGPAMVEAAAAALPATRITAVTILTSLDDAALARVGIAGPTLDAAVRLADLAVQSGARAIVCSPWEVAAIRAVVPPDIVLITPGVRPHGGSLDDQRRTATPEQALADGADLLVIGRPITAAADIRAAVQRIAETLQGARA